MLYAARIQLADNVIKPALARGQWVIGDRQRSSPSGPLWWRTRYRLQLMESPRYRTGDFIPISPCISIRCRKLAWPAPAAGRAGQNRTGISLDFPHPARYYPELAESDPRIVNPLMLQINR